MSKNDSHAYDAVIIGAGLSGLVCGCYLAKAGMKVLIAEQHFKTGGYCSSFKRKVFTFDAAAHCFGGYRKNGGTSKVFSELDLDKRLKIIRFEPANVIMTPEFKVSFWSDLEMTIDDFQKTFPDESNNIRNFFNFIVKPDPMSFAKIRSWTFKNLLDKYFTNYKLKAMLAAPLMGIGGLQPSLMSAFIGAKLFSEFLIDGGYYTEGGMQALPDVLAERFKELGGELRLSRLVKKIEVKDKKVTGVLLERDGLIPSRYVISACDARQTFLKMLDRQSLKSEFYGKINKLLPSMSDFIVYLGMDKSFDPVFKAGTSLCYFLNYDLDKAYQAAQKCDLDGFGEYLLHISHDKSTILGIVPVPFKNKQYWKSNKLKFSESLIQRIEKHIIPNLSKHIVYREAATPLTLHRYTLNYNGASYGWAGTPSQLAVSDLRKPSFIEGLYLTGHWTTLGVGLSGVIYVAQDTAKLILRKEKRSCSAPL